MTNKFTEVYGCTKNFQIHNQYSNSNVLKEKGAELETSHYSSYFSGSLIQDELPFPRLLKVTRSR